MYGEDLDWCYRIQQAGWNIYYTPETKIIHYKGESTKKGELRYVRLFYGAMLRFAEKHFGGRYSGVFAAMLRGAILGRAALSVATQALRSLAVPLFDAGIVAGTLVAALWLRFGMLTPQHLLTVPLLGALGAVLGIGLLGGYGRRHLRLRPALLGVALGLLFVGAASFFVKSIAYSRLVVGVGFAVAALGVVGWRAVRRAQQHGLRRALLVGDADEARRLEAMLATHPQPPFTLVGFLSPEPLLPDAPEPPVPHLGTLQHLRDLVRLRHLDDVVFAPETLSHQTIFGLMQRLRGLPVQFKMLAEGRAHVIGKASVDDLALPSLVEAEDAIGPVRSRQARRFFEVSVAVLGLLLHPLIWLLGKLLGAASGFARLAARTAQLPRVLTGQRALLGYAPDGPYQPPPDWDLHPAVFPIADTLTRAAPDEETLARAHWFYATHQSSTFDLGVLLRALRHSFA